MASSLPQATVQMREGAHNKAGLEEPVAPKRRCCSGRCLAAAMMFMLASIIAFDAAAVAGGVSSGWGYYVEHNFESPPPLNVLWNPGPISLRIWVGWLRETSTLRQTPIVRQIMQLDYYLYLKDVNVIGQVCGGITVLVLSISTLVAAAYLLVFLVNCLRPSSSARHPARHIWIAGLILSPLVYFFTIALYICIAIGTNQHVKDTFALTALKGVSWVPWPDWAWWISMISATFWLLIAIFGRRFRSPRTAASPASPANAYAHPPKDGAYPPAGVAAADNTLPAV